MAIRESEVLGGGTQTLEQFFTDLIGSVGAQVSDLSLIHDNLAIMGEQLVLEQQSISGVDPNEELVYMLQFQRSFQAAAQYIAAVDSTLDDLFRIIR